MHHIFNSVHYYCPLIIITQYIISLLHIFTSFHHVAIQQPTTTPPTTQFPTTQSTTTQTPTTQPPTTPSPTTPTQPPTTQPTTTQPITTPVPTTAAPSVVVTAPVPAFAGSSFTLTCTISLPVGVSVVPDVRWQGPAVTAGYAPSTVTRLGPTYTSELTLNPLTPSHGGQYTCTASYTVDGGTSLHGTDTLILTVRSE